MAVVADAVAGLALVVVGYQLDTLCGPEAIRLSWAAVLGPAVAGYGAVRLPQPYRGR